MRRRTLLVLIVVFLCFLALLANVFLTAANYIAPSGLSSLFFPILADSLKPDECASITLTNLVIGGDGSNANDLLLGTAGDDLLRGRGGDDCIVGGAGDDILNGGPDNDILLGGPDSDSLDGGPKPGLDICYGGDGLNFFNRCDEIH
jgi:Ca2+-binding RTX toxin-like protein